MCPFFCFENLDFVLVSEFGFRVSDLQSVAIALLLYFVPHPVSVIGHRFYTWTSPFSRQNFEVSSAGWTG